MIHLVFLAPYEELCGVIKQVFSELPSGEPVTHEILTDFFNNTLENTPISDAIISRGFTALTLRKKGIPYAELKTTGYDVISAVDKCQRLHPCKKIAIVGAYNMVYGSEIISHVYKNIEINSYTTDSETKLFEITERAIKDGAQAIVGGCSTVDIALQLGIPAILIESGKEAIRSAIDDAIRTVHITRQEKRKSSEVTNILNYSFQGIISIDASGTITLSNKYCDTLFGWKGKKIEGTKATDLFPAIPFDQVISQGKKILSEIHTVQGIQLLVNCVRIEGNEVNTGCVLTFQQITQIQKEEEAIRKRIYKKGFVAKYRFEDIQHKDAVTLEVIRNAESFSRSDSSLLILGETGAGKELFAQSIHNASSRSGRPFVAINCAALPEDLLESELFGYVEGAFTGASKGGKTGLFEIAHKGTIFLDEIGDISLKLQGRLLRVLQEREIIRLGADTVIPIDVRIVSATNKDLRSEVKKGAFRQDLLYRLDVLRLKIPPLRKRRDDIPCLIEYFLEQERNKNNGQGLIGLDSAARQIARFYDWPGNVRELHNFCERLAVLCRSQYATAQDLTESLEIETLIPPLPKAEKPGVMTLLDAERDLIFTELCAHGGNRKETAAALGMNVSTLWRKMKKCGIA